MTDSQLHELQNLCGILANARNMLRAGAGANSRVGLYATAPTLQETLDSASVRMANLLADFTKQELAA